MKPTTRQARIIIINIVLLIQGYFGVVLFFFFGLDLRGIVTLFGPRPFNLALIYPFQQFLRLTFC
jgi:hypothetical protein